MKSYFLVALITITMINIHASDKNLPGKKPTHQRSQSWDPRFAAAKKTNNGASATQPFDELNRAGGQAFWLNRGEDPAGKIKAARGHSEDCNCNRCAQVCCLAVATLAPLLIQLGII